MPIKLEDIRISYELVDTAPEEAWSVKTRASLLIDINHQITIERLDKADVGEVLEASEKALRKGILHTLYGELHDIVAELYGHRRQTGMV